MNSHTCCSNHALYSSALLLIFLIQIAYNFLALILCLTSNSNFNSLLQISVSIYLCSNYFTFLFFPSDSPSSFPPPSFLNILYHFIFFTLLHTYFSVVPNRGVVVHTFNLSARKAKFVGFLSSRFKSNQYRNSSVKTDKLE